MKAATGKRNFGDIASGINAVGKLDLYHDFSSLQFQLDDTDSLPCSFSVLSDTHGRTALDYAAYMGHTDCVSAMLDMGAATSLDTNNPDRNNCLIYACVRGKTDVAKLLIERAQDLADETLQNKNIFMKQADNTFAPLHDKAQRAVILAAKNGYPETLISLIAAARKESVEREGDWKIERA